MNVQSLKNYILTNNMVELILKSIKCHNIKYCQNYYTCANPDGDNPVAITVYLNDNLTTIDYTRQLSKSKTTTDIFDLIEYFGQYNFAESMHYICEVCNIEYYSEIEDIPESLQILQFLNDIKCGSIQKEKELLKPISENILNYYLKCGNEQFRRDGVDLSVQLAFEIGYDPNSNYITIPIRDGIGNLVGVKGRWFGELDGYHPKYYFLEKCAKSKVLYGYWQNHEYIKESNELFVCEAEKGVLQLASMGYRNAVATGSKHISSTQAELIIRTGCRIVLALDKDVVEEELSDIISVFPKNLPVFAIIDKDNKLKEKESPSDDVNNWLYLIKNNVYQIQ